MHRRYVPVAAWLLATACAVALSWVGVRAVLSNTVYPERPLAAAGSGDRGQPSQGGGHPSPARTPPSSAPESGRTSAPSPSPTTPTTTPAAGEGSASVTPSASASSPQASGEVKTYSVSGGRVVFEVTDVCTLVSATPNSGWAMESWKEPQWIRVDFVDGGRRNSVICSWHDHAPLVETNENAS